MGEAKQNILYYGDNLDILKRYIEPESVDLVYLDPPFKSNQDYNVLFEEKNGSKSKAQIKAFEDTWHWDQTAVRAYQEVVEKTNKVSQAMMAFRTLIGDNDMLAYLAMMAPRLVELHRVLKETGSIYLHCDPTASHYLKLLMDSILGKENFLNEIVWQRFKFHADAKRFGRVTDRVLFYRKTDKFVFNSLRVPFSDDYVKDKFVYEDDRGKFRLSDLNPPGGRGPVYEFHGVTKAWRMTKEKMLELEKQGRIYADSKIPQLKRYLHELKGQAVHELWNDIPNINPQAKERLHYQTQKPEALLERIIKASSNEGDLVLDPFCGCGTAIVVAQKLNRFWIGIDITQAAMIVIKQRLADIFHDGLEYKVIGEPVTISDAETLAKENHMQFQWWSLGLVGARPADQKKGPDRGIDGRLYFHDDPVTGETKQIIFSVKSGHVTVKDVRELIRVVDREKAQIGVLISLQKSTQPMRSEAADAGSYTSPFDWKKYPKLQILTVKELLEGKKVDYPHSQEINVTFKKAPKSRAEKQVQEKLPLLKG